MPDLLKLMTCGSVDDGKSTLIGRLLFDAGLLLSDQKETLERESRIKRDDGSLDFSLLLDGLIAEREQGITIDVAYRYFATKKRSFIVADTPGHEEYTHNMAVGASFADLAVLLVDASKGILPQTRRHLRISSLMGIRHYVLAVNKMDLIDYDEERFCAIREQLHELAHAMDPPPASFVCIPLSAALGENVAARGDAMPWYRGATLLDHLETIEAGTPDAGEQDGDGFLLPVQRVSRPNPDYRGYQGTVASGAIDTGDTVTILPGGMETTIRSILVSGTPADRATAGMAVSVELTDAIDVSRGSVITAGRHPQTGSAFSASVLWMDETPLTEGRRFWIRLATQQQSLTVTKLRYREDIESSKQLYSRTLEKNEIGCVEFDAAGTLIFDAFSDQPSLGRFLLIDKVTNRTAGCGIILQALRSPADLAWQNTDITREHRAASLSQTPRTIWFTGLSGSGKSALANGLERTLALRGYHTMLLDGDNIRHGLNRNLGFSRPDRIENIRRIAEVAKLMNDAGLIVLVSFISPFAEDRAVAREIIGSDCFTEIYVSTPLAECERRDVKGLYKKARAGILSDFTGIGSPYEPPGAPDAVIDTTGKTPERALKELLAQLEEL